MSFNPGDLIVAQWDWLMSELKAQATAGGRLSGIQDVRRGLELWTDVQPAMGVQFSSAKFNNGFNVKQRLMTCEFIFVIGAQSTTSTAGANIPPNVDDANTQIQNYISDGNGNGLLPMLLDPANRLLGGLVQRSYLSDIILRPDIKPAGAIDQSQIWAYCFVTFNTEVQVTINV